MATRHIFLDTETTGLSCENGDRIVEIGCVEVINRKLTGQEFHRYINPQKKVGDSAKIHGLEDEFLADKPTFSYVADEFVEFIKDSEVVIHNASFDVGFLDAELTLLQLPLMASHCIVVDSLKKAQQLYPGQRNSLDALCQRYKIDHSGRALHGALKDARLLAEVYLRMTQGQEILNMAFDMPKMAGLAAEGFKTSSKIIVLASTEEEEAVHKAYMADMAKELEAH